MRIRFNCKTLGINFLLIIILLGCSSNNHFKYKGEYPKWDYLNLYNAEEIGDIMPVDTTMVNYRNRIYLTIDSSFNVLLNNHIVSVDDFERHFKFVYTNPKKLNFLPKDPSQVVIFIAINLSIPENTADFNPSILMKKKNVDIAEILLKMQRVVQSLQKEYINTQLNLNIKEVSKSEQVIVEKKYPLNFAMYSNSFGKELQNTPSPTKENTQLKARNVIRVVLTKDNLLLQNRQFKIEYLTDSIKSMIINKFNNINYPENPKMAIISLQNDRETDYDDYLNTYNALKKAYIELWDEKAKIKFGQPFEALSSEKQKQIRNEIPLVISEAEPTNFEE